ncbi:translational GTPase TypA [Candidatus Saccharibacteria bacterium]|nr:translational GTPase TypA [Candidatus Saccharibacteria bacterium]
MSKDKIRNIAIIAHVDHGKTTLVDGLLKQTQTFSDHQNEMNQDLIMDSGDQEKERGITITAKITAVKYQDHKINIIDTPGHADFGGEVERTLNMADGCILVVDSQEGPMPQTKFVLKKAFAAGLKPIVVINKIDKPGADIDKVEDQVSDLFLELASDEDQLHFSTIYAIGRDGKSWVTPPDDPDGEADFEPVFKAILSDIPAPKTDDGEGLQVLVTALDWDSFLGKYAIGRIQRGAAKKNQEIAIVDSKNQPRKGKIDKLFIHEGLNRTEVDAAEAGEIIAVTGISDVKISQTLTSPEHPDALPEITLEPPTLSMYLGPNTSPLKGTEGKLTTSRQIGDRLQKELETNIGLVVEPDGIGFTIKGRGELHLSVLIETMRREGFELEVGSPKVVVIEKDGQKMEPTEEITVEVPNEFSGAVQSEFGKRKAQLIEQLPLDDTTTKLVYEMPTRALLGIRTILVTETKGTVVLNSLMSGYQPLGASLEQQRNGVLIAWENGTATPYSLQTAEARGTLFIPAGQKVYTGQIVGLNTRNDDMDINIVKEKHLTNMRASGSDGTVKLTPATILSLEQAIDFIEDDELLEVTPTSLRLRKRELNRSNRKKK